MHRYKKSTSRKQSTLGLTLVELIVTITIISLTFLLVGSKLGIASFWSEEAFIRRLRETITFLHQQSVIDQTFYQIEFDFIEQRYKVYAMQEGESKTLGDIDLIASQTQGYLTTEMAVVMSPAIGSGFSLVEPPSFPSLGQAQPFPKNLTVKSIKTPRGTFDSREIEKAYILFSPKGFSEFAVISLQHENGAFNTILINPFMGTTELYREQKDFEWTYGNKVNK